MTGLRRAGPPPRLASPGFGVAVLLLLIASQSPACAAGLTRGDGRWQHRSGFQVDEPAGSGSTWQLVSVDGALLAYRGPGSASMSLGLRCGHPLAAPRTLARHLLFGLGERELLAEGPVALDGGEAWVQRLTAHPSGQRVELKTVTHNAGGCTLDWILVAPGDLAPAEADFDRWWSSYRRRAAAG